MRSHKFSTVCKVLALLKQGKSIRKVAGELKLPRSSVHELSKRYPQPRKMSKGGRPRKLSLRNVFFLRLLLKRGEASSSVDAAKIYNSGSSNPVSAITIRRALHEIGMTARKV
ncbi:hypothetical protein BGZ49_005760, partial [Haplosporangium sp. Z 27]